MIVIVIFTSTMQDMSDNFYLCWMFQLQLVYINNSCIHKKGNHKDRQAFDCTTINCKNIWNSILCWVIGSENISSRKIKKNCNSSYTVIYECYHIAGAFVEMPKPLKVWTTIGLVLIYFLCCPGKLCTDLTHGVHQSQQRKSRNKILKLFKQTLLHTVSYVDVRSVNAVYVFCFLSNLFHKTSFHQRLNDNV